MSLETLESLTLREFFNAYEGFTEREEVANLEAWKQARLIATYIYNMSGKTAKKKASFNDILNLDPVAEEPKREPTKEETERYLDYWDKLAKQLAEKENGRNSKP